MLNHNLRMFAPPVAAVLIFTALAGCSSFDRDWRAYERPIGAPADSPIGRWQGTWLSEKTGHTGKLRCIIAAKTPGVYDHQYTARYHATWGEIFSGQYTTSLTAHEDGQRKVFQGNFDLGFLAGGVYQYDGHVQGDDMSVTYQSKGDEGTYQLRRFTPQ